MFSWSTRNTVSTFLYDHECILHCAHTQIYMWISSVYMIFCKVRHICFVVTVTADGIQPHTEIHSKSVVEKLCNILQIDWSGKRFHTGWNFRDWTVNIFRDSLSCNDNVVTWCYCDQPWRNYGIHNFLRCVFTYIPYFLWQFIYTPLRLCLFRW